MSGAFRSGLTEEPPLAVVPASPGTAAIGSPGPVRLRPFATRREDLDIEFLLDRQPATITAVLAACEEPPAEPQRHLEIWNWPVALRLARLLEVVSLSEGTRVLTTVLRCPETQCQEAFDIELPVDDLVGLAPSGPTDRRLNFRLDTGEILAFRRPTGSDQLFWKQTAFTDPSAAFMAMVRTLWVGDGDLPPLTAATLAALDEAFQDFDPLPSFQVQGPCPHCGHPAALGLDLDLQTFGLEKLKRRQRCLMQEVHILARAYGWSEAEIFALPAWRRSHYAALILKETGA